MQKIKVTRIETKQVGKGGTMVAIFDEKDTRFSGFHASLQEVIAGDLINAEIQVDGKYNNILSFEFIEKAPRGLAPASSKPPSAPDAQIQFEIIRLELRSLEAREAFRGIIDLAGHGLQVDKDTYDDALAWARSRLDTKVAIQKDTKDKVEAVKTAPEPTAGEEDFAATKFNNPGEFYTACLKYFKLTKSKVDAEIPEYDLKDPWQRQQAWLYIIGIYGQKSGEEKEAGDK